MSMMIYNADLLPTIEGQGQNVHIRKIKYEKKSFSQEISDKNKVSLKNIWNLNMQIEKYDNVKR